MDLSGEVPGVGRIANRIKRSFLKRETAYQNTLAKPILGRYYPETYNIILAQIKRKALVNTYICEEIVLSKIEDIPVEFAVSRDCSRVAYILDRATYWEVVVNHEVSGKWSEIKQGCLVFSPDSSRLVYSAERQGEHVIILDDKVLSGYGELTNNPVFSPDSKHCAFVTRHKGGQRIVVDGEAGRLCDAIGNDCPVFSPISDRLAYTEMSSHGCRVAIADVQQPNSIAYGPFFDGIAEGTPIFSPDGERVAYIAGKNNRFLVIVGEEHSLLYDGIAIGSLCFSPDSRHFAYVAHHRGKSYFNLDGHEVFELAEGQKRGIVYNVVIADDLSRIAYVFTEGDEEVLMLNDTQIHRASEILNLVFSPDARHLACVARDRFTRRCAVVLDGKVGPEFKGIVKPGIAFSPDSRHVVYTARLSGREDALVINDEVVSTFYQVCKTAKFYFPDSTSVLLVIVKEGGAVIQLRLRF